MNEELRASAEELETSRAELQPVNEEPARVNRELKIKIEEPGQANDDFKSLISSTDFGTILLDRNLRIKFFTPRARAIYRLIPDDLGTPLSDREAEVLRFIAWGYSNKEIAARMEISVKTVEAHKANAMKRLGMNSRIDIVRFALLQGWLQDT
ncbi:MAG TPA: LuxR C-terminal-related transcriptional regulator [Pyrinomonadaceae bacterium]|jgi:DNA-binding NarL/FixJ family response regulator|nr:LuxR C-terminal-related transcriptional regulator [Pyrinomonadaceae bacterium]